ncbi:DoxX family protein [Kaistia granuli]|uniref:DoxX family protein n=1 Tax=Kaistia granuli TaxID=363259 RepID=UPI000364E423|nr:DoxX family protein [Kaistia granuli]
MTLAATLILVGRVILGLFFVIAGIRNFMNFAKASASETNYGFKLPVSVAAFGFVSQLVGGLSVALGIWPAWGAALLILFLIGATTLFHNFLLFQGEARKPHLYFTLVNCALAGYCLMVIGLSL